MAVFQGIYGDHDVEYIGCTLATYEHNGAWDSDWYAVVWDDEKGEVMNVMYDTTRGGSGGAWAKVDATDDVTRKVYRHFWNENRKWVDEVWKIEDAKTVRKGDMAIVTRGRKVPKGTIGSVFWVGTCYNRFSGENERRVGIETDGEKKFLPMDYVEVIGWEKRVATGRKRKEAIRNLTLRSIDRIAMISSSYFTKKRGFE